jgi:DNA replicative helicase MCM subunit Mcm2 (Cdc46/Mcm family)
MDKLVSVKGLVIRTTPIIPDMKDGKFTRTLSKSLANLASFLPLLCM